MTKKIYSILLLILCFSIPSYSQIVTTENEQKFNADSILHEFDNGPYFGLYKDNYFVGGTTIGERPSRTNSDVKFQLSIYQRLTKSVLPLHSYLFLMYSQKAMWNVFEESFPMHDLNFNPGIGISKMLISKGRLLGRVSLMFEHESNGRDSLDSRSWNRISLSGAIFLSPQLMIHGKYWIPIVDGENNRDITSYCGIYQTGIQVMSLNKRCGMSIILVKRKGWNLNCNTIVELNYRMFKKENQYLFLQYYNGYGESLLDYNKFHSRLRIGFVIKPKFFSEY